MALGLGLGISNDANIINYFFISTWKTDNISTGSSNDNQVKLPLVSGGVYNFIVDWGDEQQSTITAYNQAEVTHTYATIGTYTIKISGTIIGFVFNNTGDKLKLLNVKRWGLLNIGTIFASYFYGCSNLSGNSFDTLKVNQLINATNLFRACTNFNYDISDFKTLNITNMSHMLRECIYFNQDISKWDTSNVTNMSFLFYGCSNFNQDISNWNTNKVTDMSFLLYGNSNFNNSLSNWNTSNVVYMGYMFSVCTIFNQSISNFNTSKVTDMSFMFYLCNNFNQSISHFDTSKVTNMASMLRSCANFNQDISSFNIELVTNMSNMLLNSTSWSRTNYDLALISWASQNVNTGVVFNCSSYYTLGGSAETARNYLINTMFWTITDLGGV